MNKELLETSLRKDERSSVLSIDDYAKAQGLSNKQVWDFIEEGLIQAKNINNIIYIENAEKPSSRNDAQIFESLLPAVQKNMVSPVNKDSLLNGPASETSNQRLLEAAQMIQNHVCMLENRLLLAKDELIEEKDERIFALTQRLNEKDKEIKNLKKALEDMQTLNFALQHKVSGEVSK